MTREEWNDLSEEEQREYFIEYGPGSDAGQVGAQNNSLPRGTEPDRSEWKFEAKDGYDVNWEELRKLANDMQYKLDGWKSKLSKVSSTSITTADLGSVKGSETFVELTSQTRTGFGEYINAIQTAYTDVIGKLKATADQYENAENNTGGQVNGVDDPSGSGNPNLA